VCWYDSASLLALSVCGSVDRRQAAVDFYDGSLLFGWTSNFVGVVVGCFKWAVGFFLSGAVDVANASPVSFGERLGVHQMHTADRPTVYEGPIAPPAVTTGEHHGTVYGYIYAGTASLRRVDLDSFTHLAWHHVDMTSVGSIFNESSWLADGPSFVEDAHLAGVKVHLNLMPHPTDTETAGSKMRSVLSNSAYRARAVAEMAALVEAVGADGVSIDFEGLGSSSKEDLVLFVQEMSAAVDEVIVATPLAFGGGYDYDELAAASDGLFIMGYDAHWTGSNPGPVSMMDDGPLPGGGSWPHYDLRWSLNDYRTWGTPDDKIIMGLPLYGRSWPALSDTIPGSSGGLDSDAAYSFSTCRDDVLAVHGERYESVAESAWAWTGSRQIWCDTLESLEVKISWALDEGIQGVGFWEVGYAAGEEDFWSMVDDYTTTEGWSEGLGTPVGGSSPGDSCGEDLTEVLDCSGDCWRWEDLMTAWSDDVCDSGPTGIDLDCSAFSFDAGSCSEVSEEGCVVPDGKWCDGTLISTCEGGSFIGTGDCSYYGATCEEAGDWAYCVDFRCPDGDSSGTECLGDEIHACVDGAYSSGDCAYYGAECGEDSTGAWCMDERCEAGPYSSFCAEDGTVGSCDVGTYTSESCADGYVCTETSDETAGCVSEDTDGDGTADAIDCDAFDETVFPGSEELCDGRDNDCDGVVDEDGAVGAMYFFADTDGDGFGDPLSYRISCSRPGGYVENNDDCAPMDPTVFPGATEICDDIDSDCDGDLVDDFPDADDDGVPECDESEDTGDTSGPTGDTDSESDEVDESIEAAEEEKSSGGCSSLTSNRVAGCIWLLPFGLALLRRREPDAVS